MPPKRFWPQQRKGPLRTASCGIMLAVLLLWSWSQGINYSDWFRFYAKAARAEPISETILPPDEAEVELMDLDKCRAGTKVFDPEMMEAVPAVFDRGYRSVAHHMGPHRILCGDAYELWCTAVWLPRR